MTREFKKRRRFYGVKAGHETLQIGRFPDRKKVALYLDDGKSATVLAYFRSEAAARECERMLFKIAGFAR